MIMPVTLAVITSTFPDGERSKAIGVWTGVAYGGGILGMYLSAALVDLASWRWLFVLPVVLVAVAAAVTLRSVPNSREAPAGGSDAVGALSSAVAVVGLVFVLHEGPERGWTEPLTLLSLAVGVIAAAGFVVWELRRGAPLLDVRLFRERGLASGSVSLLTVFGVQAGIFVVLFPFFQAVLGWSGLRSTLALMPMALLMMAASGLARTWPRASADARPWPRASSSPARGWSSWPPSSPLPRLPLHPSRHARHGPRHGPDDDAVHRGHHQRPAARAPGCRVRAQRHHPRVRHRARHRAARRGADRRYRGAIDSRLDGVPDGTADTAREGVANSRRPPTGPVPRRRRWSGPPGSPSWTAGSRPCGRARRSWRSCSCTSSRAVRGTGPRRRTTRAVNPMKRSLNEVSEISVIARPGGVCTVSTGTRREDVASP